MHSGKLLTDDEILRRARELGDHARAGDDNPIAAARPPDVRTHDVDAGDWLDSFIGDASLAMRARPGITYVEYMRTRLERDPSDLDGVDHELERDRSARVPELFEHDGGVIVLSEVISVTCRVYPVAHGIHGLTDCQVLLRGGAELIINAKYSNGLTQAMKAHHIGPQVLSVFLLSDDDKARARAGEVVPVPPAKEC